MTSKTARLLAFPLRPILERRLLRAAREGDAKTARLLLAWGARADCSGSNGFTPLTINHIRDDASCVAMAEALAEGGADPNRPNREGRRPLHYAALFCLEGLSERLMELGADPLAADAEGLTPIDLLLAFHHDFAAQFPGDKIAGIEALYERQALRSAAAEPAAPAAGSPARVRL